jgi:preprotein translocase subunit SecE
VGSNPTAPANRTVDFYKRNQWFGERLKENEVAKNDNAVSFIQDVRDEANKITWPSRRELVVSTIMVVIMVLAASFFFLAVDAVLKWGVEKVLFGI